jgi:hypothetical protein
VPTDILRYKVNFQLNSYTMKRDECISVQIKLETNSRLISSFGRCAADWSGRTAATVIGNMAVSGTGRAQMKLKGSRVLSHIQFERPGRDLVTHGARLRLTTVSGSTAARSGHTLPQLLEADTPPFVM